MDGQAVFLKVENYVNARKVDFPMGESNANQWTEFGDLLESLGATIKSQAAALTPAPTPAEDDEVSTPADAGIEDPGFGKDAELGADTVPVPPQDSGGY